MHEHWCARLLLIIEVVNNLQETKVVIVGGGFGGVRLALYLVKKNVPGAKIILISDKPHFEYHAALYRVVTGKSPMEVCIPLNEIFDGKDVEVVEDKVIKVYLNQKILQGSSGSKYKFDYLILALGSETAYFDIPGLKEYAFGFKSISEALRLKNHLHEVFAACEKVPKEEKVCLVHIVIIGAGTSGAELAGELALYTQVLAGNHNIDPNLVTIDLIEAAPRIVPTLAEDVSKKVESRLRSLGVNIFVNRAVLKEEVEQVYLRDMEMKVKTVIWTAGVKPNSLYKQIEGLQFDPKGRVLVDDYLQTKGQKGMFVIGDAAATIYSGMAQTAISDGKTVAENIKRLILHQSLIKNHPKKPVTAIPVGPSWATVIIGKTRIYGSLGWFLRRLADFRFFLSILPFRKALLAFQSGKTLCETCSICLPEPKVQVL